MTLREHYRRFSDREPGLKPPNMDLGPLLDAYERWLEEGLDPNLDPRRFDEWCEAFGLDPYYECVAVAKPKSPLFEEHILAEDETTITKRQSDGSIIQENTGSSKTIPHELQPAVTTRDDWERLKNWIAVDQPLPAANDPKTAATLETVRTSQKPVRLDLGSLLGKPRNWLGFQAFAMLPYDDPEWFEDMIETQARKAERQLHYFGKLELPLDCVHFWEDICFKNGPIISPDMFRQFALPRYRRIADLAKFYGYTQVSIDSDGDIHALLPLWIEGGVNFIWPLEVQAGMDINELQAQYGDQVMWMGGIHKHKLAKNEAAIAAELERIRPAVERGGYIPTLDHNCPSDVSYENYRTYIRLRREILGLESI